jgi:hypothetical protein
MPQINKPKGSGTGQKLQSIAPLLNFIPVVGPALGAVAGVAGGQMAAKEQSAPDSTQVAKTEPTQGVDSPMQRRLDSDMNKLQDSIQVAQTMPEPIRQQAQPYLETAYQEAMKRRGGFYA